MRRLYLLVVVLLLSANAFAWGGLGHRTIAELAERHLTPKAKANIEKYTNGTPLADYAVWMDMSSRPEYSRCITRGWHASIVDADNRATQQVRDKFRGGEDAVTATLRFTEMFKEREKLADTTVMFALKCLIHMVGDIHCPSHMRYADVNNGRGFDLGVVVNYFDSHQKLHKVYDTSLIASNNPGIKPKAYAERLDTYSKKQIKSITEGWIERWHEDAARDIRVAIPWAKHGDDLYEEFDEKALPLAETQLRKAGYRLAKVLNTLFK